MTVGAMWPMTDVIEMNLGRDSWTPMTYHKREALGFWSSLFHRVFGQDQMDFPSASTTTTTPTTTTTNGFMRTRSQSVSESYNTSEVMDEKTESSACYRKVTTASTPVEHLSEHYFRANEMPLSPPLSRQNSNPDILEEEGMHHEAYNHMLESDLQTQLETGNTNADMDNEVTLPHKATSSLSRTIRYLKSKNATLTASLTQLKSDLAAERQSRHIIEQCHMQTRERLISKIESQEAEIETLKSMLAERERESEQNERDAKYVINYDFLCHSQRLDCPEDFENSATTVGASSSPIGDESLGDSAQDNSDMSDSSDDEESSSDSSITTEDFATLAHFHLRQALASHLTTAMTILQLDDLAIKHDASPQECLQVIVDGFVSWWDELRQRAANEKPKEAIIQDEFPTKYAPLFHNYISGLPDEITILAHLEKLIAASPVPRKSWVQQQLITLYKYDVLEADAILKWWKREAGEECEVAEPVKKEIRKLSQRFVVWLQESSEEEQEDEESEEEEEEEEKEEEGEEEIEDIHEEGIDTNSTNCTKCLSAVCDKICSSTLGCSNANAKDTCDIRPERVCRVWWNNVVHIDDDEVAYDGDDNHGTSDDDE